MAASLALAAGAGEAEACSSSQAYVTFGGVMQADTVFTARAMSVRSRVARNGGRAGDVVLRRSTILKGAYRRRRITLAWRYDPPGDDVAYGFRPRVGGLYLVTIGKNGAEAIDPTCVPDAPQKEFR